MSERSPSPREYGELVEHGRVITPEAPRPPEAPAHSTESRHRVGRLALESVRLSEAVPSIDWDAVRKLARPKDEYKIGLLADKYKAFTPAIASAIAHKRDTSVERIMPTAEQIRGQNSWYQIAHTFLSFIGLGDWFDLKLERSAKKRIDAGANLVDHTVQRVAKIEKPKDQFIDELKAIYETMVGAGKSRGVTDSLWDVYKDGKWFGAEKYPLIAGFLPKLMSNETNGRSRIAVKAVAPEVIKGIGDFLASQGHERDESAEADVRKSASRRLVERVAGSKRIAKYAMPRLERSTEKVTQTVMTTLEQVYTALPESGKAFADDFYGLCSKVTELAASGYSGEEITQQLVGSLFGKKPRRQG